MLGVGSLIMPRTARAQSGVLGANDRIHIGVIGSGGKGTDNARVACGGSNVVCTALCDVAPFRMEHTAAVVNNVMEFRGHKDVKTDFYDDYRRLLDNRDIDAVIIATPDHWHYKPFLAAVEAGKHTYQEKPFSFTIQMGLDMVEAARKKPDLVIQIGTQRRSGAHYAKAKDFIDSGKLGDVRFVRAFDCRNWVAGADPFTPEAIANQVKGTIGRTIDWSKVKVDWEQFEAPCKEKESFDPLKYTAWRWFWKYAGGLVTDVGVHVVDNVHYLLGEPTPRSAVCNGGVYALNYWETPDVVNAVWDYGKFSMTFTSNFANGFEGDGFIIYGTKATLEVRGNHIKIWDEHDRSKPMMEIPREGIAHQLDWINCIRSGKRPNAPVELGHSSLLPSHLANLAYRRGTKIEWDASARKVV